MSGNQEEAIASFTAITSVDGNTARTFLDATNYNLDDAVNLYFAHGAEGVSNGVIGQTDEEIARRLAQGDDQNAGPSSSAGGLQDDNVRAPIPAKLDRLYGDVPYFTLPGQNGQSHESSLNAFRDADDGVGRRYVRGRHEPPTSSGLGDMFKSPADLMFNGGFEEAQQEAQTRNLWLLVNLQSNQEFASHQLNRDTWSDPVLKDILKGSFIFLQLDVTSAEGEKFQAYYKSFDLPAIVVVDPVTGSTMKRFCGFVSSERLMEELVLYLDHSPDDPSAHKLSTAHTRRTYTPQLQTQAGDENEDFERALALSMRASERQQTLEAAEPENPNLGSLEERGGEATAGPSVSLEKSEKKDVATEQAEAQASLPPESEALGEASCRVRVRFPDGSNLTRRFLKSHTLEVLRTFCIASSPEAASGRSFNLLQAGRGPAVILTDMTQTLEEAGLANSLVSVSWA